ncbi:PTS sugar transporter subunit IIA [Ornithinibacillus contaminans]|uniref:PTS sugar transporter subunit IIA n=1 Tax=Ornithinibacillus contaminans TaxID=694055 RepID=UPI00064E0885|nr:PTS sugar transporter subunit IIA [Ornithinibacillus contaminans]
MTKEVLTKENIHLNVAVNSKEEAIRYTGEILVKNGYVQADYVEKMLEREALSTTYMGNFVSIPHGTEDAKKEIIETGISVVTVPGGVDFGSGNVTKVLIGIAGKGDEHLEVLSKIAIVLSDEANIDKILAAQSEEEIISIFSEVN